MAPDLQATVAKLLVMLGGIQQAPAPAMSTTQVQPGVATPQIEVALAPVAVQPVIVGEDMPLEEQKMVGVFFRIFPSRFSRAIEEFPRVLDYLHREVIYFGSSRVESS